MKIKRIVNSVFTSNTFVLTEEEADWCWLVDVGDWEPLLEAVGDLSIRGLFITHTHYDHIYGINQIVSRYPDCVVYTSEKGKEGLYSDKLNFSRYHNDPILFQGKHLRLLKEGDRVNLFPSVDLMVVETPGHDWSCLSYYTDQFVFTGDSYIPGIKVITSFPHSDKPLAVQSLEKILRLTKGRGVCPGHNDCV